MRNLTRIFIILAILLSSCRKNNKEYIYTEQLPGEYSGEGTTTYTNSSGESWGVASMGIFPNNYHSVKVRFGPTGEANYTMEVFNKELSIVDHIDTATHYDMGGGMSYQYLYRYNANGTFTPETGTVELYSVVETSPLGSTKFDTSHFDHLIVHKE